MHLLKIFVQELKFSGRHAETSEGWKFGKKSKQFSKCQELCHETQFIRVNYSRLFLTNHFENNTSIGAKAVKHNTRIQMLSVIIM